MAGCWTSRNALHVRLAARHGSLKARKLLSENVEVKLTCKVVHVGKGSSTRRMVARFSPSMCSVLSNPRSGVQLLATSDDHGRSKLSCTKL